VGYRYPECVHERKRNGKATNNEEDHIKKLVFCTSQNAMLNDELKIFFTAGTNEHVAIGGWRCWCNFQG
jgi:hypothetical protein